MYVCMRALAVWAAILGVVILSTIVAFCLQARLQRNLSKSYGEPRQVGQGAGRDDFGSDRSSDADEVDKMINRILNGSSDKPDISSDEAGSYETGSSASGSLDATESTSSRY